MKNFSRPLKRILKLAPLLGIFALALYASDSAKKPADSIAYGERDKQTKEQLACAAETEVQNPNSHLFVSCGGFI